MSHKKAQEVGQSLHELVEREKLETAPLVRAGELAAAGFCCNTCAALMVSVALDLQVRAAHALVTGATR